MEVYLAHPNFVRLAKMAVDYTGRPLVEFGAHTPGELHLFGKKVVITTDVDGIIPATIHPGGK